eukprot:TRINITY_DN3590_c0_g1_i1.p1 TRINITY_DN3590_c0_g1~~TRINITY_DN3590_c0_g1_i1.p1  ORF type:complete len:256 (+),score=20.98 TRINITY_DN3590_c0_g1_i1:50-817(+)
MCIRDRYQRRVRAQKDCRMKRCVSVVIVTLLCGALFCAAFNVGEENSSDIEDCCKCGKKGPRGPRGRAGPQGIQGPIGIPGPNNVGPYSTGQIRGDLGSEMSLEEIAASSDCAVIGSFSFDAPEDISEGLISVTLNLNYKNTNQPTLCPDGSAACIWTKSQIISMAYKLQVTLNGGCTETFLSMNTPILTDFPTDVFDQAIVTSHYILTGGSPTVNVDICAFKPESLGTVAPSGNQASAEITGTYSAVIQTIDID